MAEFAANDHVSETTGATPFIANHGHHLFMNFVTESKGTLTMASPATKFATTMNELHDHLRAEMHYPEYKQEQHTNASSTLAPKLLVDDKGWLSTGIVKMARPSKKVDHKWLGPFTINNVVSAHANRLTLPASMKTNPVFYILLLKPVSKAPVKRQIMTSPPPVEIQGHKELEVEELLHSSLNHLQPHYLVKWLHYEVATLQSAQDLTNSPADI